MRGFGRFLAVTCMAAALCLMPLAAGTADAADILFVADVVQDAVNIPAVLTGEGHNVTIVTNDWASGVSGNPALAALGLGSLYDAVFWNASGDGGGDLHNNPAVFTNLTNFASAGGCVYVTGYDSLDSPDDQPLRDFIGAGDSDDDSSNPAYDPIINVANSLTTGVVDIRGVSPTGGYTDKDCALNLGPDTVGITESQDEPNCYGWTLRTVGSGEIAYVSNGPNLGSGDDGPNDILSWLDTSAGGDGAYNASLRNFANSCAGPGSAASVPTMNEWGMIIFITLAGFGAAYFLRRKRAAD